jgi:tRNA A-37 threonylcarbamoyl transferase component Bud32
MIGTRSGDWTILRTSESEALAEALLRQQPFPDHCVRVMRDDAHAFVGVIAHANHEFVVKSPRHKDRRPWIRLTTCLRSGLAFRVARFLNDARHAGIPVAEVAFAMERRQCGMIVESWLVYRFLPGSPCGAREVPQVIEVLRRLHALGWVHGDAHIANFVTDGTRVSVLDAEPRRAAGEIAQAYDFIRLRNSLADRGLMPAAELDALELPIPRHSLAYRIADAYDAWVHTGRAIKRGLRGEAKRNG